MTSIGDPRRETTKHPETFPVPHPRVAEPTEIPDRLPDEITQPERVEVPA